MSQTLWAFVCTLAKARPFHPFSTDLYKDEERAVPLGSAPPSGRLEIVRVCCTEGSEVRRLCEMGLTTGCHIQLVKRAGVSEPVIIQVGNSRISVAHDLADHFWVRSRRDAAV